jgi:hypothetical protein
MIEQTLAIAHDHQVMVKERKGVLEDTAHS